MSARRADTRTAALARVPVWLALLLVLGVWLACFAPPMPAAFPYLDSSWAAVQAFVLTTHARAGVDTVFTFGPLGWLNQPTYVAPLFWPHVLWFGIALQLSIALVCVRVLARQERGLDLCLGCAAIAISGGKPDEFALLAMLASVCWILLDPGRPLARQAAATVPLVVLALVKFTYFGLYGLAVACICVGVGLSRSWRAALALVAVQIALFALGWILCGQSLLDLPAYVRTSLCISEGYGAAMWRDGTAGADVLACVAIGLIALHTVLALRSATPSAQRIAVLAFACAATWVAFKTGFVRNHDRRTAFFDFAAGSLFLVAPLALARGALARNLKYCVLALCLAGHGLALGHGFETPSRLFFETLERAGRNAVFLARPQAARAEFERDLARKRARYDLPRVRRAIGSDPIDVFACTQAVAILNGFDYRPRPVFQSYAAYTPELQDLNRAHLESARAAPWMLFRYETMDDHAPNIEDAGALLVLLRDWRFELWDQDYLLLKRAPRANTSGTEPVALGAERARLGETIALDDVLRGAHPDARFLTLRLAVRPTLLGRLAAALWKRPLLTLWLEDDASIAQSYLVAPGYVERGFLVAPWLCDQQKFEAWLRGQPHRRVTRARLSIASGSEWAFAPEFDLELRRADVFEPPFDPAFRPEVLARVFHPPPDAVALPGALELVLVREVEGLLAQAPSELRFDLAPGTHTLQAAFGVSRQAWSLGAIDGTLFQVILRAPDGTAQVLEERVVDPARAESDRMPQRLSTTFTCARGSSLVLATRGLPGAATKGAGAYWAVVSIRP